MTEAERKLLQEFAQARIEHHYKRHRDSLPPSVIKAEQDRLDRFQALCAGLSEDAQTIAREYDKLMFERCADTEQLMYYAGFRDGIRAGQLFHELEDKPLSE